MAILKNKAFANKNLVTSFGKIFFSEDGTAEVEDCVAEKLTTLKGFSIVEEETEETEDASEEVIEDEEIEEVEVEDEEEAVEVEEDSITRAELEKLTVKQLEKYAKENEIDLAGATKRAEIISAILGE